MGHVTKHREWIVGVSADFVNHSEFLTYRPYMLHMQPGETKFDAHLRTAVGLGDKAYTAHKGMGLKQGFNPTDMGGFLSFCEDAFGHLVIRRRAELEQDASVRQLLPYTVVMLVDPAELEAQQFPDFTKAKIVPYQRAKTGGEERLYDDYSIGADGHIDLNDVLFDQPSVIALAATIMQSNLREIGEAYSIFDENGNALTLKSGQENSAKYGVWAYGFIRDDSNEVGQVHMAVVNIVTLPNTYTVKAGETHVKVGTPATAAGLLSRGLKFENWSSILLNEIAGVGNIVPAGDTLNTTVDESAEKMLSSWSGVDIPKHWQSLPGDVSETKSGLISTHVEFSPSAVEEISKPHQAALTESLAEAINQSAPKTMVVAFPDNCLTAREFAERYNITREDLVRLNPSLLGVEALLGTLHAGVMVTIWKGGEKALRESVPFLYKVEQGETFDSIAAKYGLPVGYLVDLNKNYTFATGEKIWLLEPREG